MSGSLLRTGLYVPGDRQDRFGKAVASGAELVVFDLEDAVADAAKAGARETVVRWLGEQASQLAVAVQVRVNAGDQDDLRAVASLDRRVGVRVPKVEDAGDLDVVAAIAPGRPVTALLESPRAVLQAADLARHGAVTAIALGESDLRARMGGGAAIVQHARLCAAYAAAAAGLPAPMLSVYPDILDLDGLVADTRRGLDCGLFGRMAVHPTQLAPIARVFQASPDELTWAREVLAALREGGVRRLSTGEMVDAAMAGRAERLLSGAAG